MAEREELTANPAYYCWLNYKQYKNSVHPSMKKYCRLISPSGKSRIVDTAAAELKRAFFEIFADEPQNRAAAVRAAVCSFADRGRTEYGELRLLDKTEP